ncbi:MAG: glycosyltransferase [Prevotella sp.]|jgi:glycosyltransferase|nr:glycosyltransferase family 2 protein [Prevotella sp.]MCH4017745.1 glycosyltransferase [Prevotella sp.]
MLPKISIIIATYNSAAFLERALRSVKNQIFKGWECIMIDGCSTDDTVDIFKKFAGNDERFSYISEKDRGVYDAFNKGWQKAKGEWIYYLGSDDELLPNGLNELLSNSDEKDIIYGGIYTRYKSGKLKKHIPGYWERSMPFQLPCSHQAIIMKRSTIARLGGFNTKYHILADFDLMNHAFFADCSTKRVPVPVSIFQLGGMSTDSIKSLRERYDIHVSYGISKPRAFAHQFAMFCRFLIYKIKHKWID